MSGYLETCPGPLPSVLAEFLQLPNIVLEPRNAKAGQRSPPYWGLGTRSPGAHCAHKIRQMSISRAISGPSLGPKYRLLRWGCGIELAFSTSRLSPRQKDLLFLGAMLGARDTLHH